MREFFELDIVEGSAVIQLWFESHSMGELAIALLVLVVVFTWVVKIFV